MNFLPEPDPVVLGFFFFKKFVYLEVLAVLAALRLAVGQGIARWPALVALLMALGGVATVLAPAAGLNEGPLYVSAARFMGQSGGMAALLVPSAVFLISTITPRARWRWLDILHLLMLAGLLLAWWWIG
ncbi:hypothetical protein [Pseudoponticoccus marisrubri]|uniref:Uncharacterized protein n=1 Tax=Pseudoponticoccus marisrubri TaxID=1685382 RepID=A0A0W7WL98_9RHOB|nr:hypothetical protein [Pseudoponticoccus marisrubri]KUF11392.1 hypothetical protein AVJ23_06400 [Pseudoponticoccus marisrubri]